LVFISYRDLSLSHSLSHTHTYSGKFRSSFVHSLFRKKFLVANYPESFRFGENIYGENYPIPDFVSILLTLLQVVQLACLAIALCGEGLFRFFGMATPTWYFNARENPMLVLALVFFIVPTLINSMMVSGAFEVELDGSLIYSKMQTGRMASGQELLNALQAAGLEK